MRIRSESQQSSFLVVVLMVVVMWHAVVFPSCRAFRNSSSKQSLMGLITRRFSTMGGSSSSNVGSCSVLGASSSGSSSMGNLIDGKKIAADIRKELTEEVTEMKNSLNVVPGLAVVLVGERRDSKSYVGAKKRACAEVGISSFGFDYPTEIDQAVIVDKVRELNADPAVNGILVQLPLPPHIDEATVLSTISPDKDVDGLHPLNVARLSKTSTRAGSSFDLKYADFHIPCTPQGCIELLERYNVNITGKHAVVLGRSNIVGIPMAMLLMHKQATVTIAHSKTTNLEEVISHADIVVAAVGKAEIVKGSWLKPGSVLIDVGINSIDDPTDKRGYRLVGDAEFESCKKVASLITPVPGGVGPMTIAMLLRNTVYGARRSALSSSRMGP